MKTKRNLLGTFAIIGLSAGLAICILAGASSAQSKDDRKDRSGGDRKREEPNREEKNAREPSRDRTADREPVRESKDRPARAGGDKTSRERPSRNDETDKNRPSTDGSESGRDRNPPAQSGSSDKRTVPSRSTPGGTTVPDRRRPPGRPGGGDYDRSRDGGSAGTRPVDPVDPPVRPPRRYPEAEAGDGARKKDVPIPDDRIRIVVEGWPCPPPWYPVFIHPYIVDPGYRRNPYLIHLPFGTIEPRGMDEEFLALLNDLWHDGLQEALLVCIVQTYRAMDVDRFELFFRRDDEVTIYGSFSSHSFLALLPVRSVFELLDDPRIRWVGEYKPYYKINDSVKLWDWDGVFIFPLERDRDEFRDDLLEAGLTPDFYDEEIGFYFIPAEPYELEALSEFWWVAEVLQVVSDPDLVYGYDYRIYE